MEEGADPSSPPVEPTSRACKPDALSLFDDDLADRLTSSRTSTTTTITTTNTATTEIPSIEPNTVLSPSSDANARPDMGSYASRSSPEEQARLKTPSSPETRESGASSLSPASLIPVTPESLRRRPSASSSSNAAASADFQPIGAEVSEEKAQQLKNDVKRLSPIHVSLRERTLGEVSLRSEPLNSSDSSAAAAAAKGEDDDSPQRTSRRELVIRLSRVDAKSPTRDSMDELAALCEPVSPCPYGASLVLERVDSPGYQEGCRRGAESKALVEKLRVGDEIEFSQLDAGSSSSSCSAEVLASMAAVAADVDCAAGLTQAIMTRLDSQDAFTDDSAEALGAAGDEVRSDGSDSGLGSEMTGPAPAAESDSESSFLDRIPDDILSVDKPVNQLDGFAADVPKQPMSFRAPAKSSLKRRLTDCFEDVEEPGSKRLNVGDGASDAPKKKRNIQFDAVTVYYFPRAQGFTCVPSQGGSTLGMSAAHTHAERFSLSEHAAEQRRLHRARLAQLRSERAASRAAAGEGGASSSEDPSDDTDEDEEEPSDGEELDIDSYYFLQPVPTWQRRALLRAAGVRRIDALEKDECRDIRASREHCGCACKGYCDPESCPCSRANVKCQVDRAGFPCGCSRDGCANSSGRIEFNPVRVRTHFIHTLMRLELEKKPVCRDEEQHLDSGGQHSQSRLGLSMTAESSQSDCLAGGGFTGLHYDSQDGARLDSLDLYTIREDCYSNDDCLGGGGDASQRKLHQEFGQTFQHYGAQGGPSVAFQQNPYADYQAYQNLPSTSRSPFQPQFQPVAANNGFAHYGSYSLDSNSTTTSNSCHQNHPLMQQQQQQQQHSNIIYDSPFPQEEMTSSLYTNLNSIQPINAVVGKLEPFSELLSTRYSYYGEVIEQQSHQQQQFHLASYDSQKLDIDKNGMSVSDQPEQLNEDDCDENFGEIIKKSMVETVSA